MCYVSESRVLLVKKSDAWTSTWQCNGVFIKKSLINSSLVYSENTNLGEVSLYGWPPIYFVEVQLLCLCWISNCFTRLVKSKPVKQEVSRIVILPPMMSFTCGQSYKAIHARKLRLHSRSISNFLVSTTLQS